MSQKHCSQPTMPRNALYMGRTTEILNWKLSLCIFLHLSTNVMFSLSSLLNITSYRQFKLLIVYSVGPELLVLNMHNSMLSALITVVSILMTSETIFKLQ